MAEKKEFNGLINNIIHALMYHSRKVKEDYTPEIQLMQEHKKKTNSFLEKKVSKYIHHKLNVSVIEALKGQHKEHCLCYYECKYFKPGKEDNCPIAQKLFEFDKENGVTTPVFECKKFEKKA